MRYGSGLSVSDPNAGFANAFMAAFQAGNEKEEEKKKNQALWEAYQATQMQNVAPQQELVNLTQEDAFKKQMIADSSAMASGLMANNPNYTQKIQGQSAPVAPAQVPAIQQQFQATNQANLQQANSQAQQAEQMLQAAQVRYGTAAFEKVGPLVMSGKLPAEAAIKLLESTTTKAAQQADKMALGSAMKVFGDKNATQEQKTQAAVTVATLRPELGRMFQNFFAPKEQQGFTLGQGQTRYDANGKPVASVAPKADKPTGQLTEYQKWQMEKDRLNPPEKTQNIPGFGNITNAQILSLYNSSQPKEVQREAFNPLTGAKEMMKSIDPGKPETMALLKPYVDKIKGVTNPQPATSTNGEPPIDEVIASVQTKGEEQTLKLLTEAFGAKKAEELLGRSRAYSK